MAEPLNAPESADAAPLQEFWRFATDFHSFYARIAKLALAGPLLDFILNLGPPWPSRVTVSTAMVLVQILILACSFAVWRQGKTAAATVKKWLVGASIGSVSALMFLYLPAFIMFVRDDPDVFHRVVVGYQLQPRFEQLVAGHAEQSWPDERLLREFEDAQTSITDIWRPQSVFVARYVLLVTWLAVMSFYAIAISAFVALQYRQFDRRVR